MLRSRRYATWAIRDLNLKDGDEVDYIRGVTTAFRASEERPWPRMRELVREKGIDPGAAALADFFPDRYRSFIGVIVTADGPAFGFSLLHFGDPEHPSQWDWIFLLDWRELSEPKPGSRTRNRLALPANSSRRNRREPGGPGDLASSRAPEP
jgi:hypothetical protein